MKPTNKNALQKICRHFNVAFFIFYFIGNLLGQNNFYLKNISSEQLQPSDKIVLDSIMPLYHSAKHDTIRLAYLEYICDHLKDYNIKPFYDSLIFKLSQEGIATGKSNEINIFKRYYGVALNNFGYNQKSIDKKLEYLLKAMDVWREINYEQGITGLLNSIGQEYYKLGNHEMALDYFQKVLLIHEKNNDKKQTANILNNFGLIYKEFGDISRALEYYQKALFIREKSNDSLGIAYSFNSIGVIYDDMGELEKALEYYQKSLFIAEKFSDMRRIATSLNNIGYIYNKQGNFSIALEYYQKSLFIREEINDKKDIANSLNNIGGTYENQNNVIHALEFYQKALTIQKGIKYKLGIANSLKNIGKIYFKQKKYLEAKEYCNSSLQIAQELGMPSIIRNASELLSKIYKELGNYKNAYEMMELFKLMSDSLNNQETQKTLFKKQFQYEYEKKESLLRAEQEKKNAIATTEKKRQRIILFSVMGGLIMVVVIALIIFRSLKISQRQRIIIAEQKKRVDEKQKEIVDSISYAKRLQQAILPPMELIKKYFQNSFVLYKPKDIVAGDFYWMEFTDNTIFIAAADSTGHGVPGAMVSVVCSNALNRAVKEFALRDTGKILDKVTDLVLETFEKSGEQIKDGMDISFLSYNKTSKQIQWSGANNPLWYTQNEQIIEVKADKQPIGKFDVRKPFTTNAIEYCENTTFYLFTDGLPDQFGGPKGKKFMYKRFETNLSDICKLPMDEQQGILEKAFQDWKGNLEQVDDVTIICIKI